jgi:energy-converting hydrogenase Eha subunit B
MELDMDGGFELNGEMIASPDKSQRASYVAMSLLYGIETENNDMVSIACAYLANRLPDLKQIRAIEKGQDVTLDFIFDEIN